MPSIEPCSNENCGSRRFHQGTDGYTYCDQGHQQSERGAVVAEDTGELIIQGRKARRIDSDAESSARTGRSFTGAKALEHYLVALQLVLRKQVSWLVGVGRLPAELEALVKDLWALRLRKLQIRVSYDSETDTEGHSQMFSSQSEGESGTETAGSQTTRGGRRKKEKKADDSVNLGDTLVLCYISVLLLRIPMTVADFIRLIDNGSLPYYQASKVVPSSLKQRLPGEYQVLLEPPTLLTPQVLQQKILEIATLFDTEVGMTLPAMNHPLLLYRWMQELTMPIEIFAATSRLARTLDVDFKMNLRARAGSNVILRYPEVQLMALLVVSTKFLFPLDDIDRKAVSLKDLSALRLDWSVWVDVHTPKQSQTEQHASNRSPLSFGEAFNISESDCLAMGDEQLDQYLDWYQDNMASETVREQGRAGREADFRRTMMRMFPTQSLKSQALETVSLAQDSARQAETLDNLKNVQRSLRTKTVVVSSEEDEVSARRRENDKVYRTGSFYRRHRDAHDLEGPIKLLYERAAELAGVSLDGMTKAVFLMERRLEKHEEQLRMARSR